MGIDIHKLSDDVREDIAQNQDVGFNDSLSKLDNILKHTSVEEAFNMFLEWNGIVGYTSKLIAAYESIKAAEIKDKTHLTLNKGHIIDCWHEGSKSYYRATIIQPLTLEEVQTP